MSSVDGDIGRAEESAGDDENDDDENESILRTMLKLNNNATTWSFVQDEETDVSIENVQRRNTLALRAPRGGRTRGVPVPLQSPVNTPKGTSGANEFGVKSKTKTRIKPRESTPFPITNCRLD